MQLANKVVKLLKVSIFVVAGLLLVRVHFTHQ